LKNPGRSVSTNTNTTWFLLKRFRQVLILVDPVDDEEIVHELILFQ
jgi:hypothetical protein